MNTGTNRLGRSEYYRGNPAAIDEQRAVKLRNARHRRKEANLKIHQRTLPLQPTDN